MAKSSVRRRFCDRGAAAVEMALVLPLLLLVVFGIIDFGRALNAQEALTEAAREGARASTVGSDPSTRVNAVTGTLGAVTTTVNQNCSSNPAPGDDAKVTVSYTFTFITPVGAMAKMFGGTLNGTLPMSGVGVMPCRA